MEKKRATPVIKGLIICFILILYGFVLYITEQYQNTLLNLLQYVILIGGVIWSCVYYAKQMDGNVTFGNVFAEGFKTTAFIAALMAVYTLVSVKFIFPEMIDKIAEATRKQMEKDGKATDEQIKQGIEIMRKFFIPFAMGGILLFFAIAGAIGSAIGAAIAKKNPSVNNPFDNPNFS
ncbi:MAG TPA: DUF4199 domain-containing protein [Chitinophagaceae bacterium]|nr:DUF4199 domain-containing protein [Chitinophagaceae bacterium]